MDWTYAVDIAGNEEVEHEGLLDRPVAVHLSFERPGVYRFRVTLTSPNREEVVDRAVFARDPAFDPGVPVIAQGFAEAPPDYFDFEGIAVDPNGTAVYVATFRGSRLFRLDAERLETLDSVELRLGVEGLAVSPGSEVLFAAHKRDGVTVLELPSLAIRVESTTGNGSGFFIHALDTRQVLIGGNTNVGLVLYDAIAGDVLTRLHDSSSINGVFHFSVHPSGRTVAATVHWDSSILFADIPTLAVTRRIDIPGLQPRYVVFHPREELLYVLATQPDTFDHYFLVVDLDSGDVLSSVNLGQSHCFGLCVANPVATSRNGEWVVFANYTHTLFVDTATHAIVRTGPLGSAVAASPTRDEFYFVDSQGVVSRVGYPTR